MLVLFLLYQGIAAPGADRLGALGGVAAADAVDRGPSFPEPLKVLCAPDVANAVAFLEKGKAGREPLVQQLYSAARKLDENGDAFFRGRSAARSPGTNSRPPFYAYHGSFKGAVEKQSGQSQKKGGKE